MLNLFFLIFKAIYLLYAKLEENHGLARRALKIYEKATEAVPTEDRYEVMKIINPIMAFSLEFTHYLF